jgi:histidinol-phosphate aminotransferase
MTDYHRLPHKGIQSLAPYVPGKSIEEVSREWGIKDIIKLASNENPLGCSPLVKEALAGLTNAQIATYPIAGEHPFRQKLADQLGVNKEAILLANGSDALIPLLQTCFALCQDRQILTHQYAFIAYGIFAKTLGIPVVSIPLQSDWQIDVGAMIDACHEKIGLIFMASPNNPTGVLAGQDKIQQLLDNIPKTTLLVVDEAYYDYVHDDEKLHLIPLLKTYPNLILLRTFSKVYGLAALRLGYAIASELIAPLIQRVLPPFGVNIAALTAANAALDDPHFIQQSINNNRLGLRQMQEGLKQLQIDYLPSAGNFLMFDCKKDSVPIYQALQKAGVIVRPLHGYGLNHYLRVTIGTPEQNKRFLDHLAICMKE